MRPDRTNTVTCAASTQSRGARTAGRAYERYGAGVLRAHIRDRLGPALAATLSAETPKAMDAATGISWRTVEGLRAGRHMVDLCGALAIALARPGSPFAREIRALLSGDALAQDPKIIDAILRGTHHG
jgi:hypothetical protein